MTLSENLVTQNETFQGSTKITLRRQLSNDLETEVILMFQEFSVKTLYFDEDDYDGLMFSTDQHMVMMQFCLQGNCRFGEANTSLSEDFAAGEYNILYVPKGEFRFAPTHTQTTLLNVFIQEEFFLRHIPANHFAFQRQRDDLICPIFRKNSVIKPQLKNVLKDIRDCEFDTQLKKLYLMAKVMELLTLQLVQHNEVKMLTLKSNQVAKMAQVRELIDENLGESLSLAHLARTVGTNEQYLKSHFKLLYGQTVFRYMLSSKMEKAKEMLLSGENSITEIADAVGYKHATHFTSAFKKFFGHLPRLLKTKFLLGSHFLFDIEFELLEMLIAV